ncbi:MAG: hypothetical protein PHE89_03600 [Alphaproteobacteria bacterium]|nr:hypothetical protein [Alphaproteobacteria bacterium]
MVNRKDILKLSGRAVAKTVEVAAEGAQELNELATDSLDMAKGFADQFSGSSSTDIAPKVYKKLLKKH